MSTDYPVDEEVVEDVIDYDELDDEYDDDEEYWYAPVTGGATDLIPTDDEPVDNPVGRLIADTGMRASTELGPLGSDGLRADENIARGKLNWIIDDVVRDALDAADWEGDAEAIAREAVAEAIPEAVVENITGDAASFSNRKRAGTWASTVLPNHSDAGTLHEYVDEYREELDAARGFSYEEPVDTPETDVDHDGELSDE